MFLYKVLGTFKDFILNGRYFNDAVRVKQSTEWANGSGPQRPHAGSPGESVGA